MKNDQGLILKHLRASLCGSIEVGGLVARNPTAHKWKAPWRALLLRECVAWRSIDLLTQSWDLYSNHGVLGARILLRAAHETLAVLIYVNQSMRKVVAGELDFHAFSETTARLLLGSRDQSTPLESINILTILGKADKRYPGLLKTYAALSESAHPNHEGMVLGYSTADRTSFKTAFSNRWPELYGEGHPAWIMAAISVFSGEYDDEWVLAFEELEKWIEAHDAELEATKSKEGDA